MTATVPRNTSRPARLAAASGVLICLAIAAQNADAYYWVDRILPSTLWSTCAAILVLGVAVVDKFRGRPLWALPGVAVSSIALLGLILLTIPWTSTAQVSSTRSPDGRVTAVVNEATAMIDPVWEVRLRQHSGPLSRQWYAGCLNGDSPIDTYEAISWIDDTTLEVRIQEGEPKRITVDPSGRPLSRVGNGDDICP